MYQLTEKVKEKILFDCFDDVCEAAQKEETGVFKALANTVAKANIFFDKERDVAVVISKRELSPNYVYRLTKTNRRVQILEKIDATYYFEVKLNGEVLKLECNQYTYKYLE